MQCGGCGTLVSEGQLTCPNCGRMVWSRRGRSSSAAESKSTSVRLGDSSARMDEIELSDPEMGDADELSGPGSDSQSGRTLDPDPVQVLALLAREPELLEAGLSILREKGEPVGVDYATDVGNIDLLARDARGGLLVVMMAKGDSGTDIVAEILQRIGWVRKRVAKSSEGVRGLVVMEKAPENLSYAAAAVSDTVSFRTYRMTLRLDPVEI